MSLRQEFVDLAIQEDANMSQLCRRYGISRPTGYKWLKRYREEGPDGLRDRSRRPKRSPEKTPAHISEAVCTLRRAHPAWGGRKLRRVLMRRAERRTLQFTPVEVPAPSTCQAIIKRNGLVSDTASEKHTAFTRFEKERPNELWQMDFKGHFALTNGARCHPFSAVDDHSRFLLDLRACPNQQTATVKDHLTATFRRYGLPRRILCDNGPPWGTPAYAGPDATRRWTKLGAWLLRLGVQVSHGRPRHPQTQGKQERFHRTLEAEVLRYKQFNRLAACQARFTSWRATYNHVRPHEAIDDQVPASHYQISDRTYPEELPPVEYGPSDTVRKVQDGGWISFQGEGYRVGRAFCSQPVALRPAAEDDMWSVYYCHQEIETINVHTTLV